MKSNNHSGKKGNNGSAAQVHPLLSNPVCYGMAGVGGFGRARRQFMREAGCFRLKGGVDVREEAFQEAEESEGHSIVRYGSVEEMVQDPELELVVISTPAHLHVEQAFLAARAGKAIFTEKPLGHDLEACRELVQFCEDRGIPHGHGFGNYFNPLWQLVRREMIENQLLGRIVGVSLSSMHTGGLVFAKDNWRFNEERNPGGPLFQCGIHKLDLLYYLFGEGEWLHGMVVRGISGLPVIDGLVLSGRFAGIPVTFHSHYVASYWHNYEFYGTDGNFIVDAHPEKLLYKKAIRDSGFEPVEDWTHKIAEKPEGSPSQMVDLALAVREGRQPMVNGQNALHSIESIYQALSVCEEEAAPQSRAGAFANK